MPAQGETENAYKILVEEPKNVYANGKYNKLRYVEGE
jgi:hypothetical protein